MYENFCHLLNVFFVYNFKKICIFATMLKIMQIKSFFVVFFLFLSSISTFGQAREIIKCRIWKTSSYCTIPNTVNIPENAKYSVGASITNIRCSELDKQKLVGIWVTVREKNVSELHLKNNFNNVKLIRKDSGEVLYPVAYMSRSKPVGKEGNPQYLSGKSTFGGECVYELKPRERYDLFILFEAAEVGDKLVIEDFFEAEIR